MLSRIFTRLFYAVIFFAAGVWAAPHLGGASRWIDEGVAQIRTGAVALWAWGEETFSPTGFKPSSQTAAKTPAPAAAPTPAPSPSPTVSAAAVPASAPAPVAAAKPVATADAGAKAAAPAPRPSKADDLSIARAAYARGDVAGAVRAYEDRLTDRPDDSAAAGELGNVLWANGRRNEAAASWHRAATALIASGRRAEAEALVQPIRSGDPSLADDLARRLAKAAGTP